MSRLSRLGFVVMLLALAAGCGSVNNHPKAAGPPVLSVASIAKLGNYLVVRGYTVYTYPPDKQRGVTCTKAYACSTAWPPLFVKSGEQARAGTGVNQSLIGSMAGDGGQVVTYNHWPLYYYEGDRKVGQVNGQDQSFDWFVMAPDGHPIHTSPVSTG